MARGKGANFSRRKRSFIANVSGKRDAKSRAASLFANVATIDLPATVMGTRVAEATCLLMDTLRDPSSL
jgi:hypothetical protein